MSVKEFFEVPRRYRNWSLGLIGVGVLSLLVGFLLYGASDDIHHKTRFWATLMHNSIYFLKITNISMFFICASILGFAGWHTSFRRVPEAIAAAVPVVGIITLVILLAIVMGGSHMSHIYHWTDAAAVEADPILKGKKGFLNIPFYITWTVLTIGFWSFLGWKIRKLSYKTDEGKMSVETGKKHIWNETVWAALFIVWFALTAMSVTPWFWLMSIDAHWYSTMYSWYTFASTFVGGLSLMLLFVVYLKNNNRLEFTNTEHIHDIGKFIFAFSIFWAYLWFSQFMLIWYANIPEETTYFRPRATGAYSGVFWFSLIINFLAPLLILMKRSSKRNYATMTILALVLIFGHWLDFHQMIFASVAPEHVEMNLFDFGIALGFIGVIMLVVGRVWSKHPLIPRNHPFMKESVIHHT